MHIPNAATAHNNFRPVLVSGGLMDNKNNNIAEPADGAALATQVLLLPHEEPH